jgi:hypothetical protein
VTSPALPDGSTFDPTALDLVYQDDLADLLDQWQDVADAQVDDLLAQVRAAVEAGDPAALAAAEPDTTDAETVLAAALVALLVTAAALAVVEALAQGVSIPGVDLTAAERDLWASGELDPDQRDLLGRLVLDGDRQAWLDGYAHATAARLGRGLGSAASEAALRLWQDPPPNATAAQAAATGNAVAELVDGQLGEQPNPAAAGHLGAALHVAASTGRHAVFDLAVPPQGEVIAWFASERFDTRTCGPCAEIDGTRFADIYAAHAAYPTGSYVACEGRWRCRGLAVPVWVTG